MKEVKEIMLNARITKEEKAMLEKMAQSRCVSLSEMVRVLIREVNNKTNE